MLFFAFEKADFLSIFFFSRYFDKNLKAEIVSAPRARKGALHFHEQGHFQKEAESIRQKVRAARTGEKKKRERLILFVFS